MSLIKYEIFIKVVEVGSLTKVGNILNLTQSAISHAISSLEDEFGLSLLTRGRSGIKLTDSGERLLRHFKKISQLNEQLYQEVAWIKGLEIGTFSTVSIK